MELGLEAMHPTRKYQQLSKPVEPLVRETHLRAEDTRPGQMPKTARHAVPRLGPHGEGTAARLGGPAPAWGWAVGGSVLHPPPQDASQLTLGPGKPCSPGTPSLPGWPCRGTSKAEAGLHTGPPSSALDSSPHL